MKEKKWLKYLCLFALALLVAIPAAGVKVAQVATVSGSCGDKATYAYDEDTGKLTISGSGTVEYTSDWDDIVENVKTIGDSAFQNCAKLTTVDMGSSSVTKIGGTAFYCCSKLKTVTFSKNWHRSGNMLLVNTARRTACSITRLKQS